MDATHAPFVSIVYTQLNAHDWLPIYRSLDTQQHQRISRFLKPEDRDARVAAIWLLRHLADAHQLDASAVDSLSYSPLGRPYFPQHTDIDFNVSHSGRYVICGMLRGARIGVDIECIQPVDPSEFESVFPAATWNLISSANDPQLAFYSAWTRMEAVAKAEGFGISGPTQSIVFSHNEARVGSRSWRLLEIPIDCKHVCHVASSRPISLDAIREI